MKRGNASDQDCFDDRAQRENLGLELGTSTLRKHVKQKTLLTTRRANLVPEVHYVPTPKFMVAILGDRQTIRDQVRNKDVV